MNPDWKEKDNKLQKTFMFENFNQALAFVNDVGALAEQANHHPDIFLHDYKNVDLTLTTHDAGGVTDKDHELAKQIESLYTNR